MNRNKANVNRIRHKIFPNIFMKTLIDGDGLFSS